MEPYQQNLIIYNTADGKASVTLYAKDGMVWMSQNQLAELFATSVPNISMHIANILEDKELKADSVIKEYLTTAADGKEYQVTHYSLEMILAIGFRVRNKSYTLCSLLSWSHIYLIMRIANAKVRTFNQTFLNRNALRTELSLHQHRLLTGKE